MSGTCSRSTTIRGCPCPCRQHSSRTSPNCLQCFRLSGSLPLTKSTAPGLRRSNMVQPSGNRDYERELAALVELAVDVETAAMGTGHFTNQRQSDSTARKVTHARVVAAEEF